MNAIDVLLFDVERGSTLSLDETRALVAEVRRLRNSAIVGWRTALAAAIHAEMRKALTDLGLKEGEDF